MRDDFHKAGLNWPKLRLARKQIQAELDRIPYSEKGEAIAPEFVRFLWRSFLEPPRPTSFFVGFTQTLVSAVKKLLGETFTDDQLSVYFADNLIGEFPEAEELLRILTSHESFDHAMRLLLPCEPEDKSISGPIGAYLEQWKPRVIGLTPGMVATVREISAEYIQWIKAHPRVLETIAWEAFEKLVAEIFASHGFHVELTSRVRNRSADIIAVRTDELGVDTRYLVECKRHSSSRPISLDIVNGVIGAARRADVDHAFLVTSSVFSSDVRRQEEQFRDLRLHLRDGDDVREWLQNYTVRADYGLWLHENWDSSI